MQWSIHWPGLSASSSTTRVSPGRTLTVSFLAPPSARAKVWPSLHAAGQVDAVVAIGWPRRESLRRFAVVIGKHTPVKLPWTGIYGWCSGGRGVGGAQYGCGASALPFAAAMIGQAPDAAVTRTSYRLT